MHSQPSFIQYNEPIGADIYRIGIGPLQGYARSKPGQFVMLRISERIDPLLRRPFSIHRLLRGNGQATGIEIWVKVVGKGTAILSQMGQGARVDVLGPLGSAFLVPQSAERIFIVAGGIGVAPMVFLVDTLLEAGIRPADCSVFLGAQTQHDMVGQGDFLRRQLPVIATTDDGSTGEQCLVTHPVEETLRQTKPDVIYGCGPVAMLQCLAGIAETHGVPCQVSIETTMACGIGVCLGCAVQSRRASHPYLHACLDGPVFDTRDIEI